MKKLVEAAELAEAFGLANQTLANWRWRGIGPPYIKVGGHVRYCVEDVETWLNAQTRGGG